MTRPPSLSHIPVRPTPIDALPASPGVWRLTFNSLKKDKLVIFSLAILIGYFMLMILTASGLLASHWDEETAVSYAPPALVATVDRLFGTGDMAAVRNLPEMHKTADSSAIASIDFSAPENPLDPLAGVLNDIRHELHRPAPGEPGSDIDELGLHDPLTADLTALRLNVPAAINSAPLRRTLALGADKWGHSIVWKVIKGTQTSLLVGLISAALATLIGTLLGALAGYFGGVLDDVLNWFYNVFTAVPYLLLILAVAAVLQQKGILVIILILGLTGWTGTFRLMRAEYLKHRRREYVLAAAAIGVPHWRRMTVHIFPNVSHVALVQMSLMVVGFIKSEVILSFLGFGVPVGSVSWGSMLNEAPNELIMGKWWQLTAVTLLMALLVTAFSLFTDGLRDALDPKTR